MKNHFSFQLPLKTPVSKKNISLEKGHFVINFSQATSIWESLIKINYEFMMEVIKTYLWDVLSIFANICHPMKAAYKDIWSKNTFIAERNIHSVCNVSWWRKTFVLDKDGLFYNNVAADRQCVIFRFEWKSFFN